LLGFAMLRDNQSAPPKNSRSRRAAGGLLLLAAVLLVAQSRRAPAQQASPAAVPAAPPGLEVIQLRPNFYVLAGAGANISVQTGDDGIVLVDSGDAAMSDRILTQIKALSRQPLRY